MPGSQEDEAVRIFVEFERIESATKGKCLFCLFRSTGVRNANVIHKLLHKISLLFYHGISKINMYIFLLFLSSAIVDLNGRYFGGRVVKACFYNLDKFRRLDLGDEVF